MDNLRSTLTTFSEEEKKTLTIFVQRQTIKHPRKDLQLLTLLSDEQEYTDEELLHPTVSQLPKSSCLISCTL